MGKQKIEIKKIENEDARLVSFSKRRSGLFNKASCLATLCGVDVAVVVFSPAGTPYSFGSPRVEMISIEFDSKLKILIFELSLAPRNRLEATPTLQHSSNYSTIEENENVGGHLRTCPYD
uniref:MADS42 n=1 Tax=Apostasia odorata TaxID=280455 RepID=A0A1L1WP50_9ASPA|nr:MADS42 [Apostasia odorata]